MSQIFKLLKLTKKFWPLYLITSAFVVLIALLNLANPILNKQIVDVIEDNVKNNTSNFDKLVYLLVLVIIFDIVITIFTNIAGYLGDRLGQKLNTFLSSKFYRHILSLELSYFDNNLSGGLMNKLQRGIENISNFINQMLNSFLPFFLTAFFTVIYMGFYSWEIAVLLALLFPLYIVISERSSKAWIAKQGQINGIQDSAFGRVLESISSIRVVKSFVTERLEFKTFRNKRREIEEIAKKQSYEWHRFDIYRRLILNIILFAIYAYVIYYTYNGRFSIAEMILLLQLVNQARFPLFAMSFILSQIQQAQAGSKDFLDVLAQEVQIKDKKDAINLNKIKGNVAFEKVTFNYEKDKNVIKNISFNLKSGEKMAIVGESGGGKSTLANLLLRFYEPQNGDIKIDGKSIFDVTQASLHQNIGVVLQDSLLFSGTLKENISYGKPNATDEEIINAAKAANCHDFISNFPEGYESQIGEKGVKLSGGQKQRLSIARAILKNAPILILDEATSALDSKAEKEVQAALNKLMEGRTTIIIAHRLSTIKNVDHILVLKSGEIVEEGSPSKLAKENGIFAELLRLQSTTTLPDHKKTRKLKEFDLHG